KSQAYRFKLLGWQGLGRKAGPKRMKVACHGGKASNAVLPDEIINLAFFQEGSRNIAGQRERVALSRPLFGRQSVGQVLGINPLLQGSGCASPDFPCCLGVSELFKEPGFLLRAQDALWRLVFTEIGDFL